MRKTDDQPALFENPPAWTEHWGGMPSFEQKDLEPDQTIMIHFRNKADMKSFSALVCQTITPLTKSIWYPKAEICEVKSKRYSSIELNTPRYPVYVISKGRWESRLTSKALEAACIPYHIVIEPQEYEKYSAVIDPRKILVLPFSNLGQGSIPARNWVWQIAIECGAEKHWILDDNIEAFGRITDNSKIRISDSSSFCAAEDFSDRYSNLAMCGFNYDYFMKRKFVKPAFILNTRIYSCILIDNSIPHRWRGRYNEDTDLSLCVLKAGYCTVLFNALLQYKATTMTMKGGNSDELYKDDGRLKMAESLRDQHPDIVKVTWKFNRWQHQVDYSRFKKNKLVLKPGVVIPEGSNEYGMQLEVDGVERSESEAS